MSNYETIDNIPGLKPGALFIDDHPRLHSDWKPVYYYILEVESHAVKTLKLAGDNNQIASIDYKGDVIDLDRFRLVEDQQVISHAMCQIKKVVEREASYHLKKFNDTAELLLVLA